jgi:hypothetical protein
MDKNEEKRKVRRRSLEYDFEVVERETGMTVGKIVNISLEGMMLIATDSQVSDTVNELQIRLPETINDKKTIDCKAKCMWCKKNGVTDFYEAGFRLVDIHENDIKAIVSLIARYRLLES